MGKTDVEVRCACVRWHARMCVCWFKGGANTKQNAVKYESQCKKRKVTVEEVEERDKAAEGKNKKSKSINNGVS